MLQLYPQRKHHHTPSQQKNLYLEYLMPLPYVFIQNSKCKIILIIQNVLDGWRYIPIELIDLPGLIKDAWKGKGLGNQFLSIAAQSDALLHIVDASGGIDSYRKNQRSRNW